jgi:5-methylcytosine-specific restriction endonuclease McrA
VFDKKAWTKANRERVNAQARAWYHRNAAAVKAKYGAKCRKRAAVWARANRERAAGKSRAWRKANPEYRNYLNARTRARKRAGACSCCAPISFKFIYLQARSLKMHVDHVHPLAKGGKHCLRNLQLLEPIENIRKGARWAEAPT